MSARKELLRNLRGYERSPYLAELADDPAVQLLDAYRAEVLREAAAKLRAASPVGPVNLCNCGESLCEECDTHKLINTIDPDTP